MNVVATKRFQMNRFGGFACDNLDEPIGWHAFRDDPIGSTIAGSSRIGELVKPSTIPPFFPSETLS